MQLYIGGYAQGKLAYVQEKLKGQKVPAADYRSTGKLLSGIFRRISRTGYELHKEILDSSRK